MNIPASYYITSAYNDGSCPEEYSPTKIPPIGVENIRSMGANDQMEIACHGNYHICDISDAKEGERNLREWLKIADSVSLGFAVPNSSISKEEEIHGEWKVFRYVRTGPMYGDMRWLQVLCRKFCRVIPVVVPYRYAYRDCVIEDLHGERDVWLFPSVPVLKDTTLEQVYGLVHEAVSRKGHLILMFHSIGRVDDKTDNWTWHWEKFLTLCTWLKELESEGVIRLCTVAQLQDHLLS